MAHAMIFCQLEQLEFPDTDFLTDASWGLVHEVKPPHKLHNQGGIFLKLNGKGGFDELEPPTHTRPSVK